MSETTDTELRELLAAATPGPWRVHAALGDEFWYLSSGPDTNLIAQGSFAFADAELIAAAVNALPGLLDRAERAEKERDSAQEHLAYHLADYLQEGE